MRRNWDLIRGMLRAIDIDYDLHERLRFIQALVELHGAKDFNYHLCLVYEAKLVRYSRPFYSEDSLQLEVEPIQLTKEGIELLSLMKDDDSWERVKSLYTRGGNVSQSDTHYALASALDKYFLSRYANAA